MSTKSLQFLILLLGIVLGEYIPPGPKWKCPPSPNIWPCRCHTPSDLGISLVCKDVSLATLSAALAHPVAQNIPVNVLEVMQLNTEKLYGPIFNQLNCTRIRIQDSPLQKIYSDVFFNTRHTLKELELISTKLEEFPVEAFAELEFLESLTLDGHSISQLNNPIKGLPSLKNIRISNGNITEFAKGTFTAIGSKLVRLDLHGNTLKTVPKDAFANLKNLEYLDISWNSFDKLDPTYFFHLSKLTWFNGSHNAFPDFKRGAFARNGFLRVIVLTNNNISKIDAAAFRGMRLLVRLYLSDNQITEVGRAAFNSLQRIKTIDLARNRLSVVDFQMFLKLPFCEEIFLQENNITAIKAGSFNELTSVLVNVSYNQLTTVEKGSFTNVVNITILDMSHNLLKNFSRGAFDENSYTDDWRLQHNFLELTTDVPIKFMGFLRVLNVSYNKLREVGKNTFPKLYELHTVDFSHNNLSKIHSSVFGNLFGLRSLDLRYNNMTDITGSTFGTLPTLLELQMDHNRLKTVSSAAFTKLVSLRSLSLSYNNMTKVSPIPGSLNELNLAHNEITSLSKAWPTMNALQRLDLSYNNLGGNLEPGSFSGLAPLAKINLAANNITEIPAEALSDIRTCQHIDLSHNSISSLGKAAFGRLPVVFTLLLNHNNISTLAHKAFEGLIQLLHLDLSHNSLEVIPAGALANLVSLRTLNLSHNALQRTENGTHSLFEDCLSMLTLDLSFNSMSSIYTQTFPQQEWTNYKLAHVNLSHNALGLVTREYLRGTRTLLSLDLSYNKITEVKPNLLQNLALLEKLDLSHNSILNLEPVSLGPPPALRELNLEGNGLRRFPVAILSKAPLQLIDLRRNKFRSFLPEFLPKVENGSRILLQGNPLGCDCGLIPFKRYFENERQELSNRSLSFFADFTTFQCSLDEETVLLKDVEEPQLICDYSDDPLAKRLELEKNLDVAIRSVNQNGVNAQIRWRVKSKRDILGFIITILGDNAILRSTTFGYSVRGAGVNLPKNSLEICVVPNLSSAEVIGSTPTLSQVKTLGACRLLDGRAVSSAHAGTSFGPRPISLMLALVFGFGISYLSQIWGCVN